MSLEQQHSYMVLNGIQTNGIQPNGIQPNGIPKDGISSTSIDATTPMDFRQPSLHKLDNLKEIDEMTISGKMIEEIGKYFGFSVNASPECFEILARAIEFRLRVDFEKFKTYLPKCFFRYGISSYLT
jgi:hypothetical protein